jgi:hypothetical protein
MIQLAIREQMGLPPVFGGVRVVNLFSFLCCVVLVSGHLGTEHMRHLGTGNFGTE